MEEEKKKFYDGNGGSNWTEWSKFIIIGVKSNTEVLETLKDKIAKQDTKIKVLQMQIAAILFVVSLIATKFSDYVFDIVKKLLGG